MVDAIQFKLVYHNMRVSQGPNQIRTVIFIPSLKLSFDDQWRVHDSEGPDSYNGVIDCSIIYGKVPAETVQLVQELFKNPAQPSTTIDGQVSRLNRIGFPTVVSETIFEKLSTLKEMNKQYRSTEHDEKHFPILNMIRDDYKEITQTMLVELERMEVNKDIDNTYYFTTRKMENDPFAHIYVKYLILQLKKDERFRQFDIEPKMMPEKTVVAFYW